MKDVGIDSIGVFFGIMAVRICCWTILAPVRTMERERRRWERKRERQRAREEEQRYRRRGNRREY